MSFWDLLRPPVPTKAKGASTAPPPATAAALKDALTEAEAATIAAEQAAGEVAEERAALLLAADDSQLDAVDRRLQLAQRAADKTAMAVETLKQKLAEAVQREHQAELDARFAEGQLRLRAGVELMQQYGDVAVELLAVVAELQAESQAVDEINRFLRAEGDPRRVPEVDETARPEDGIILTMRSPIWDVLRIPSSVSPHRFIHPQIDDTGLPLHQNQVVSR